jgi:hypothetical protein
LDFGGTGRTISAKILVGTFNTQLSIFDITHSHFDIDVLIPNYVLCNFNTVHRIRSFAVFSTHNFRFSTQSHSKGLHFEDLNNNGERSLWSAASHIILRMYFILQQYNESN